MTGSPSPLSKAAHDECHRDIPAFEAKYGTHAELLVAYWQVIGFVPGEWMAVGMSPRRTEWFKRVVDRVLADGTSDYELEILGRFRFVSAVVEAQKGI
jgi:hypothetical protein